MSLPPSIRTASSSSRKPLSQFHMWLPCGQLDLCSLHASWPVDISRSILETQILCFCCVGRQFLNSRGQSALGTRRRLKPRGTERDQVGPADASSRNGRCAGTPRKVKAAGPGLIGKAVRNYTFDLGFSWNLTDSRGAKRGGSRDSLEEGRRPGSAPLPVGDTRVGGVRVAVDPTLARGTGRRLGCPPPSTGLAARETRSAQAVKAKWMILTTFKLKT